MARTWQELFETGEDAPAAAAAEDGEPERRGFFRRLRENMSKTREAIGAELQTTMFQSLDDEAFERLEETLIYADVGAPTTAKIVERLEMEAESGDLTGGEELSRRLRELLADTARVEGDTIPLTEHPTVILVTGVNGSGKTTTIGKMAWHLQKELGRSVLLAAGDTFRAAAALKVSPAAISTDRPSSFCRCQAILPIVVVLPLPLTPTMRTTVGFSASGIVSPSRRAVSASSSRSRRVRSSPSATVPSSTSRSSRSTIAAVVGAPTSA